MASTVAFPADHGLDRAAGEEIREARRAITVHLHVSGTQRQAQERAPHRKERRLQNIETVNLLRIGPADAPGERACANEERQAAPLLGRQYF